jgi:ATP-dependent helicase/nuclease subunit A
VHLHGLTWEEPAGLDLLATEKQYLLAERRRVVYVAATRARDLLVVPSTSGVKVGTHVCADLLAEPPEGLVVAEEPYRDDRLPAWAQPGAAPRGASPGDATDAGRAVSERWTAAAADSARPRLKPASVSGMAAAVPADELTIPAPPQGLEPAPGPPGLPEDKPRTGRFGSVFGTVVHRAVGVLLHRPDRGIEDAVRDIARAAGLTEHLDAAADDVRRVLDALRAEGQAGPLGPGLRVEYPVAAARDGGLLVGGYIDVVGATADRIDVIDIKTDAPPAGPVEHAYPEYAAQVTTYGALLQAAGAVGPRRLRCGLLFTADGVIRWVASAARSSSARATGAPPTA